MSQALPETVDAWRMVQARRRFEGSLPLAAMPRLVADLAGTDGEVRFDLEFDRDAVGVPFLRVQADATLPLTCQRTLERFEFPAHVDSRLGLIAREADEATLPAGYEPLLTADGSIRLAEVVEDELLLALPAIPVKPGTEYVERSWGDAADEIEEPARENPFEALKKMKFTR